MAQDAAYINIIAKLKQQNGSPFRIVDWFDVDWDGFTKDKIQEQADNILDIFYTKDEVNALKGITFITVDALPALAQADTNAIYVKKETDGYTEYIVTNGAWNAIGGTGAQIDTSNFATKSDLATTNNNVTTLQGTVTDIDARVKTTETDISGLQKRVDTIGPIVQGLDSKYLKLSGGTLTGTLEIPTLTAESKGTYAANKEYVDKKVSDAISGLTPQGTITADSFTEGSTDGAFQISRGGGSNPQIVKVHNVALKSDLEWKTIE